VIIGLRELAATDIDRVAAIEAVTNPSPWPRSLFAGELDLASSVRHWVVAVAGDAIVGFGGLSFVLDTAHLLNLGVDPAFRRRGIGRCLCLELLAEARRRGVTGLTLEVREGNHAAIALYRALGMTASGTRPGYYPDGENAMIFWTHDLQAPARGCTS
jgi:ribosomal-protein-alanine N-acetyltransferase